MVDILGNLLISKCFWRYVDSLYLIFIWLNMYWGCLMENLNYVKCIYLLKKNVKKKF